MLPLPEPLVVSAEIEGNVTLLDDIGMDGVKPSVTIISVPNVFPSVSGFIKHYKSLLKSPLNQVTYNSPSIPTATSNLSAGL
ncbi:MAG: hypothetical protein IPH77_19510 [Ignavibacteria bacterium]|nr:hypothetical protein [Ignavibacteria bacterium]